MFFLASNLVFDPTTTEHLDRKSINSLCKKLQNRFPVIAKTKSVPEADGVASIVVVAIGRRQDTLSQLVDDLEKFCEDSGFGRIESEQTMLESFDALDELE